MLYLFLVIKPWMLQNTFATHPVQDCFRNTLTAGRIRRIPHLSRTGFPTYVLTWKQTVCCLALPSQAVTRLTFAKMAFSTVMAIWTCCRESPQPSNFYGTDDNIRRYREFHQLSHFYGTDNYWMLLEGMWRFSEVRELQTEVEWL